MINNGSLDDSDKQEALTETEIIAEAAAKSKEEQKSIASKALCYFKGLAADLKNSPATDVKLIEIIAKIIKLPESPVK